MELVSYLILFSLIYHQISHKATSQSLQITKRLIEVGLNKLATSRRRLSLLYYIEMLLSLPCVTTGPVCKITVVWCNSFIVIPPYK